MSSKDLDTRELLADTLATTALILGKRTVNFTRPEPKLLSKRWMVFQVPSSATANYVHYVVGSLKDGFLCSCVGMQAHGYCYHARAVRGALELLRAERKNGKRDTVRQHQPRGRRPTPVSPGAKRRGNKGSAGSNRQKGK